MWSHASAIVWAQWRSLANYFPRASLAGTIFSGVIGALWYGSFLFLAVLIAVLTASAVELDFVHSALPTGLLLCFLYWQVIPILMASMGSALDIRKLMVYPIPTRELFTLDVILRVSTGVEVLLVMMGAAVGLLINPKVPLWGPATLVIFIVFNLFCSTGIRDLVIRLMSRRRIREIAVFIFVLIAALPQLLILRGSGGRISRFFSGEPSPYLPWTAAARLVEGQFSWMSAGVLLGWTVLAFVFGRWQFEQGLSFDADAANASSSASGRKLSRFEWFFELPNKLLKDPLANLIEKELRFLTRANRFRLVFFMGFSFGLLVWFPMAFGRSGMRHSLMAENYLTFVSVYALLLLSDALFWNCLGFDRSAAQVYFLGPLKISTVLAGKNIAAVLFVVLEITMISIVCALLRLPFNVNQVLEAMGVTAVVTLFLLSIGNLSSVYMPRGVNPSRSVRTAASGRMQAALMVAFPLALLPVALAYLARYAFATEWALFGVLLVAGLFGAIVYKFALTSASEIADRRKEEIIVALSRGEGPVES